MLGRRAIDPTPGARGTAPPGEPAIPAQAAGDRLPAIRHLASQLDVNRDTVALAYEALAAAGLVESAVGRGTFVRGPGAGRDLPPQPAAIV